jgi:hypothetical protein
MTDERHFGVALFAVGLASTVVSNSLAGTGLGALGLASLVVGYRMRSSPSVAISGLFIYYPLSLAVGRVVPGGWSFVVSSILVISLAERLDFEYHLSKSLESPLGIDEESRNLAMSLSESHFGGLLLFIAGSVALALLSFGVSDVVAYYPLLAASSILLVFVLWVYTRR